MDRRSFMKLFGIGSAAAASVPSVLAKSVVKAEKPPRSRECGGWPSEPTQPIEPYAVDTEVIQQAPKEVAYEPPARAPAMIRGGRTRGDLRGCTITFRDGNDQELTIQIGEGSLTWTEHQDYVFELDRGRLDTVRQADPQPVDVELDMCYEWAQIPEGYETPMEFLRGNRIPDGLTMLVEMDEEWYEFRGFFWDTLEYDLQQGTLSLSGRCMDV